MIFDTHAHYYDDDFDPDRDALLSSLPERGVALVVCPGCDLASSEQSVALAGRYPFLYAAAGYHPENLEGVALGDVAQIRALCAHEKVVAVGEIGLDYYWVKTPEERAFSRDMFDAQLSLAEELDLPAIVHDRDAHKDCLDMVRAHPNARGVFHCYSGSIEDAKVLVDRGWMLSFTGNITFKNARRAPEVMNGCPWTGSCWRPTPPTWPPSPTGASGATPHHRPLAETVAQLKGLTRKRWGDHPGKRQAVFGIPRRRPISVMETISYEYEGALYVNLTNRATAPACSACGTTATRAPSTPTTCGWSTSPPGRRPWTTCWPGTTANTGSWCSAALVSPCTAPTTSCGWWTS